MSKPRTKATKRKKPFVKTDKLEITALHKDSMITGFTVTKEGKTKEFKVHKNKILDAWMELEKWIGNIKH